MIKDLADDFDRLIEREQLSLKSEWREQMLVEYAQLRMNMDVIHELANSSDRRVDPQVPITYGRVEI